MQRRDIIAAGLASATLSGCSHFSRTRPFFNRADLMAADAESGQATPMPVAAASDSTRPCPSRHKPRADIRWAERINSIDYHHISASAPQPDLAPFALTSSALETFAVANSFSIGRSTTVIFGLRGATLVDATPNTFTRSITIRESIPDHNHLRCLIGLWRPAFGDMWLTRGSTVPNSSYMNSKLDCAYECNLLPTGLHRYIVAPHAASSNFPQPGAFRQAVPTGVLRIKNDLCFEMPPIDDFDFTTGIVYDDIHAGRLEDSLIPPYYSSAGCQVVPGGYSDHHTSPYGDWAKLRELAGLNRLSRSSIGKGWQTVDDGREFHYMLLTGAEIRLFQQNHFFVGNRLRFGSSGQRVKDLQTALRISSHNSEFDLVTMRALVDWQLQNLNYADGILTPEIQIKLQM
jgi:hypothetical protein